MCCDHRSPDHPSRLGLKDVLMSRLDFQTEGVSLLASMLRTAPRIGKGQAMGARGDLYVPDPRPWVESPGIERHEAYCLWQHQARIRLRTAWLLGSCDAAQQPEGPSQEQHKPTYTSAHESRSMGLCHEDGIGVTRLACHSRCLLFHSNPVAPWRAEHTVFSLASQRLSSLLYHVTVSCHTFQAGLMA